MSVCPVGRFVPNSSTAVGRSTCRNHWRRRLLCLSKSAPGHLPLLGNSAGRLVAGDARGVRGADPGAGRPVPAYPLQEPAGAAADRRRRQRAHLPAVDQRGCSGARSMRQARLPLATTPTPIGRGLRRRAQDRRAAGRPARFRHQLDAIGRRRRAHHEHQRLSAIFASTASRPAPMWWRKRPSSAGSMSARRRST
jgi:hypothetical protein